MASSEQTEPTASGIFDAAVVDPDTGFAWPARFDTKGTARYLQIAHALPIAALTLVRQRSKGIGIHWKYLGQKPIAEREEIDRFAREDALRDVSPLTQARAARQRWEQRRPVTGGAAEPVSPTTPARSSSSKPAANDRASSRRRCAMRAGAS